MNVVISTEAAARVALCDYLTAPQKINLHQRFNSLL